jgi:hypothetical protein
MEIQSLEMNTMPTTQTPKHIATAAEIQAWTVSYLANLLEVK